jgi:O-antigen/teichoic acid export membrane protein
MEKTENAIPESSLSEHSALVAKGSFWSLAGSVFFKLSSFIYAIILARVAAQDDVGVFYLGLSIIYIVGVFSDLGISGAFIRYVPYFEGKGQHGKIKDLMRLSYAGLAVLSILIMAVLVWQADAVGAFYGNGSLSGVIRILSLYILVGNLFRLNYLYLQGTADIKNSQFYQNIQNFTKLVLTIALFYLFGASSAVIAAGFVLSFLPALLLSSPMVLRAVSSIKESGRPEERLGSKELFSEVIPLGVMIAILQYFSLVIASSDRLIMGFVLGRISGPQQAIAAVAVYSFATTMASVLIVFPAAIGNIFLPVVSRLAGREDMAAMREVMATSQRWSLFVTLPIAVVMMAFSGDMMHAFYGAQYESGGLAMAIFTFGLLFSCISYTVSLALAAMRLVKIELIITAAGGIVNAALNFALIPVFGMEGAATASLASFLLTALLLQHYGEKLLGFRQPGGVYKLLLAALATFAIMLALKPYASLALQLLPSQPGDPSAYLPKLAYLLALGVMICLAAALFVASSLLLRCFKHEDVALMARVLKKAMVPQPLVSAALRIASYGVK